ncbi:MAG: VWA domain-containing protein [Chloroflexota bacterium]
MSFGSPMLLWGLLIVPAAVAAYLVVQRRRMRYAVRFTNLDLLANLIPQTSGWRRHVPAALYVLALSALLLSLARPRATVPVPKEQATVVMVMDTSGSMTATDVQPSRLTAAKGAASAFLDQLPAQFRVAVVSFASTPQTLARPTTDRVAVRSALDSLRAVGGTAMGDAVERAIEVAQSVPSAEPNEPPRSLAPSTPTAPASPATPASPNQAQPPGAATPGTATPEPAAGPPPAAILLLSDGASTAGRTEPLEAAARAQELGIPVYTIALGTPTGTLEMQGQRLAVPPDEATLRQIAEMTGGQFFTAPTANDLRAVYQDIGSRIGFEREQQEITFAFAAAGAVLLAAGSSLGLLWFNRFP